jgi:hypothetical protein
LNKNIIVLFLFISFESFSNINLFNERGLTLHLPLNSSLKMSFNHTGQSYYQKSEFAFLIYSSIGLWNVIENRNYIINYSDSVIKNESFHIEFAENGSLFGPGVMGLTNLSFDSQDGKITGATIQLNKNIEKVNVKNVLSHELGHLLGLAHSQIQKSTMFYENRKGQDSLHDDDLMGMKNIYGSKKERDELGSIKGRIVGLNTSIGIFGVQVLLISANTGKVLFEQITDDRGNFKFSFLPLDEGES